MYRAWSLAWLCLLGGGCGGGDPDFCTLLTIEEVTKLDAGVATSKTSVRGKTAPTRYCVYTNRNGEEVFMLSMGTATKNPPTSILQVYARYMDGSKSVRTVPDVGNSAAALFSDDYEEDRFRILIANNDKWSVTIRAKGIRDESSPRFDVVKELADKALSRF